MNGCHRFYLHVGVHKTGITALQKFFEDNDKQLSASDLYQVKTGLSADVGLDWGHHPLARALIKRGDEADLLWQSGAHEVTGRRNILVSSEVFSFIRRHSLYLPLRRALPGFLVRPKCYLRRQDQMLESIYNHNVKALGETDSIMEFAKRRMGRLDHTTLLACLSKSFGKEAIIVRIYDPKQL